MKKNKKLLFDEEILNTEEDMNDSPYTIHKTSYGTLIRKDGKIMIEVATDEEAQEWIKNQMKNDSEEEFDDSEEDFEDEEYIEIDDEDEDFEDEDEEEMNDSDEDIEEEVEEEFSDSEALTSDEISQLRELLAKNNAQDSEEEMDDSEEEEDINDSEEEEIKDEDEEEEEEKAPTKDSFNNLYRRSSTKDSFIKEDELQIKIAKAWEKR